MKTTIIGSDHAGLVSGACLAELVNLAEHAGTDIMSADIKVLGIGYHGIGREAI